MEGGVEVCTPYSSWGTVCNKQWTSSHTRVVCRNLGLGDSDGNYYITRSAPACNMHTLSTQ